MRLVIFTGDPMLRRSPWWTVVMEMPGLTGVMVCRKTTSHSPRDVLRRFRANIAKHGLIFLPYRIAVLVGSALRRRHPRPVVPDRVPVEELTAHDIHAPEVLDRLRAWAPDLGLSIGAPILRRALFELPAAGTINIHSGAVPEFRGAPPGFWELMRGAQTVGATAHWVDEGLDTGDIIGEGRAPVYAHDSLADVEARAAELAREVLRRALAAVARGDAPRSPQPSGGQTHRLPTVRQRFTLWRALAARRARRLLATRELSKALSAWAAIWIVRPVRDALRTAARRHPVRVFTFHRVTDLCRDGMTVSPSVFAEQVRYIARHHRVVSLDEALEAAASRARLSRPLALITFDDAYRSVLEHSLPVLRQARLAACCFASTALVGTDRRFAHDGQSLVREFLDVMSWDDLLVLLDAGWSVGGHTATHARLADCTDEELAAELSHPVSALRERLGVERPAMAYPFGARDDVRRETLGVLNDFGYRACFSNHGGENQPPARLFELHRIDVGGDRRPVMWRAQVHGFHTEGWRRIWDRVSLGAGRMS